MCSSTHCLGKRRDPLQRVEVETEFDGIVNGFLDLGGKIVAIIAKVVVEVVERIVAGYHRGIIEIITIVMIRHLLLRSQLHLMNVRLFFRLVKKSEIVNNTPNAR